MQRWLKILPDNLVPKLFAMLRASCPTLLSQAMIAAVRQHILVLCAQKLRILPPPVFPQGTVDNPD
jgi:hypothetical protein